MSEDTLHTHISCHSLFIEIFSLTPGWQGAGDTVMPSSGNLISESSESYRGNNPGAGAVPLDTGVLLCRKWASQISCFPRMWNRLFNFYAAYQQCTFSVLTVSLLSCWITVGHRQTNVLSNSQHVSSWARRPHSEKIMGEYSDYAA